MAEGLRIAIMAAGGVGGFLAANLIRGGADVAVIARGRHLQAIRNDGLTLAAPKETFTVRPSLATERPEEIGPVDVVVFAVKLPDLAAAAEACRPLLKPGTGIVPFQNGVEATDILAGILGAEHAMMGTCYIFADIAAPGRIGHSGPPGRFFFGEVDGSQSERSNRFREALKASNVDAPIPPDVRVEVWRKFAYLAALSGVTAAARTDIGGIRAEPALRAVFVRAIEETLAVAKARGITLPADSVARYNHFIDVSPAEATSSLAKDLAAGKPLEVDWLSGAVARLGAEAGVDTPVHATLHGVLKPYAEGSRRRK